MPRPRKRRRVCSLPKCKIFGPLKGAVSDEIVNLSVDEYEVIRLIDLEGLDQVKCAERMEVARSTIQRIYTEARKKLAEAIVKGKMLKIEGGDYELCKMDKNICCQCNRKRHRYGRDSDY